MVFYICRDRSILHRRVNIVLYFLFQLSVADIAIHVFSDMLGIRDELNKCKRLAALIKKVDENKNIAKWLKEDRSRKDKNSAI